MKLKNFFNLDSVTNLDCINIDLSSDIPLFIHPDFIKYTTDEALKENGLKDIQSFFNYVLDLYSVGKRSESIDNLFTHSVEDNSNHLGESSGDSKGHGMSQRALTNLFDELRMQSDLSNEYIAKLNTIGLGPDFMSDLISSILKKRFVDYTLSQAKFLGIPIENNKISYGMYWNSQLNKWDELTDYWIKGPNNSHIVLTPCQIVSTRNSYFANRCIQKIVWNWKNNHYSDLLISNKK